jgi:hypothetical protein
MLFLSRCFEDLLRTRENKRRENQRERGGSADREHRQEEGQRILVFNLY